MNKFYGYCILHLKIIKRVDPELGIFIIIIFKK